MYANQAFCSLGITVNNQKCKNWYLHNKTEFHNNKIEMIRNCQNGSTALKWCSTANFYYAPKYFDWDYCKIINCKKQGKTKNNIFDILYEFRLRL